MNRKYVLWMTFVACHFRDTLGAKCPAPKLPGGTVTVILNEYRPVAIFRCSPPLLLVGDRVSICAGKNLSQWNRPPPTCVSLSCTVPDVPDNVVLTEEHKGGVLRFSCTPGSSRSGPEIIWCNGTGWSESPPSCVETVRLACDFEDDHLCGWSNDGNDQLDWLRWQGETPNSDTGPRFDHTFNNSSGHYIYFETSRPVRAGNKAQLRSPIYRPMDVNGTCLEFYYHMHGPDVGHLEVFEETLPDHHLNQIFHLQHNQGNNWRRFTARTTPQRLDMRLLFQATAGAGVLGDIAVDDIRMYPCDTDTTESTVDESLNVLTTVPRGTYRAFSAVKEKKNISDGNDVKQDANLMTTRTNVPQTFLDDGDDNKVNDSSPNRFPTTSSRNVMKSVSSAPTTAQLTESKGTGPSTVVTLTSNTESTVGEESGHLGKDYKESDDEKSSGIALTTLTNRPETSDDRRKAGKEPDSAFTEVSTRTNTLDVPAFTENTATNHFPQMTTTSKMATTEEIETEKSYHLVKETDRNETKCPSRAHLSSILASVFVSVLVCGIAIAVCLWVHYRNRVKLKEEESEEVVLEICMEEPTS